MSQRTASLDSDLFHLSFELGGGEISLVMSATVTDVILLSLPPVSYRMAGLGLGTQAGTPAFFCEVWGSNLGHQGGVAHSLTP